MNGVILKYLGFGYVVYVIGGGKIDLLNSRIELRGRVIGFEMVGSGILLIILNLNIRIYVYFNDVIVMNIKDMVLLNYFNLNLIVFNSYF